MSAYDAGPIYRQSTNSAYRRITYHKLRIHQRLAIRNPRPPRLPNVRIPLRLENETLNALQTRRILIIRKHPSVNRLNILLHIIRLIRRANAHGQHHRADRANIPRGQRMCRELREGLGWARRAAALATPR
jgi:hypothetical protein